MDIKEFIYITTIAREQSLSQAADRLCVSEPTLSVFLSTLEKQLGTDLFYREKKRLYPTPQGKIWIDTAQRIIDIHDRTYLEINKLHNRESIILKVAATPFRGAFLFSKIYPRFAKRFPGVRINIHEHYSKELILAVDNGDVDFGLGTFSDLESGKFDYLQTSREEIVVVVPKLHRAAALAMQNEPELPVINIEQLIDSPFIMMSQGTTLRTISDSIMHSLKLTPLIIYETANNQIVLNMVSEGFGIGFLPRAVAAKGNDVVCFSLTPSFYMHLGLIHKKGRPFSIEEEYFACLAMENDRKNPLYLPPDSEYSNIIYERYQRLKKTNEL